jgi:predicted transcriptional regulator of viral defense system
MKKIMKISDGVNIKSKKGEYIEILLRSPKTVFSTKDVALLWGEEAGNAIHVRLSNYVKNGKLIRVHRGMYAKDKNYDRFELGTKIYTPSYVSFETVLTRAGVNFQYYGNIFVASYVTREIEADGQKISFVRMKDFVLSNTIGIEQVNDVSIATKERAFLDRIYVSKEYHFDHLDVLDWNKVFEILPIYRNKRMEKKVKEYYKDFKKNATV